MEIGFSSLLYSEAEIQEMSDAQTLVTLPSFQRVFGLVQYDAMEGMVKTTDGGLVC